MDNFVTLMTFSSPIELSVLRTKLEDENIEYRVLDENTSQLFPKFSNITGGTKLQVKESDVPRAIEIIKEGGFVNEDDYKLPDTLNKIDEFTSKIPIIKNFSVEVRIMIFIIVGILFIAEVIFFLFVV